MGVFDAHLKCSIAGTDFQLKDYSLRDEPVLSGFSLHSKLTLEGEGWIEGTSPADYNAKLIALKDAMRSATDVVIFGLSGLVESRILAARCYSGPWIAFELEKMLSGDEGGYCRRILQRDQ